ncbi:uncharacterized protein [Rutidosis leptorrhynchoides]|uniref:uncharacterized protein isoform X2 n=1 Tax=Rutidosis leptorrhynchoides TaxID=125765 RepID=UPI003A9957B1
MEDLLLTLDIIAEVDVYKWDPENYLANLNLKLVTDNGSFSALEIESTRMVDQVEQHRTGTGKQPIAWQDELICGYCSFSKMTQVFAFCFICFE